MWGRSARRGALLLGAALLLGWARADVHLSATVRPPDDGRATHTVTFRLANSGAEPETVTPSLELPPGWRALLAPAPLSLGAGADASGLLVVVPPANAAAGEYAAWLRAGGARVALRFTVAPRPALRAEVSAAPEVAQGAAYTVTYRVANVGNVAQDVRFSVLSSRGDTLRAEPERVTLAPGAFAEVRVRVPLPAQLPSAQKQLVFLRAAGQSEAVAFAATELIPDRLPLSATHVTLPFTLELGAAGDGSGLRPTARAWGAGELPSGLRWRADLNADAPVFGVGWGALEAALGYQSYGQTGLVPRSAGPGLRVAYETSAWGVEGGVFGASDVLAPPLARLGDTDLAFGVSVHAQAGERWRAAADWQRQGDRAWWALSGAWRVLGDPGENLGLTLGLNLGGDFAQRWQGRGDAQFVSDRATARLSVEHDARAQNQAWRVTGNSAWQAEGLRAAFGAAYGNTLDDPVSRLNAWAELGQAGAHNDFGLTYRYRAQPRANEARHETELAWSTNGTLPSDQHLRWTPGGPAALRYEGRVTLDSAAGAWTPSLILSGPGPWRLGGGLTWTGALGANAQATLGGRYEGDLALQGELRWPLARGTLSASGEARLLSAASGLRWRVGYALPLEVPLAPRRDVGRVAGRVTNEAGEGVAGLVLRLGGQSTRTNARGEYDFPAAPEGEAYLVADAAQLGPERLTRPELPRRLVVRAQNTVALDVRLERAAGLSGRVALADGEQNLDLRANVLLELRGEDGAVRRTFSDEQGHFQFQGLLAGRWTLGVPPQPDARHAPYSFQILSGARDLHPGEEAQVEVRLVPRSRSIPVQDGGTLTPLPAKP